MKLRAGTPNRAATLADVLAEADELHLLEGVEATKAKPRTASEPVISNFLVLVDFVAAHGHEPRADVPEEKLLAVRLNAYRTRPELRARVLEYDTVALLAAGEVGTTAQQQIVPQMGSQEVQAKPSPTSLEEIFLDDDQDLLGSVDTSIFQLSHVPAHKVKETPDEIASRKPCEDFYRYEKLFHDLQNVLKTQAVMQTRFCREETVVVGNVFILRGMLCYIDSILKENTSQTERDNPRLRVIFENGTETDLSSVPSSARYIKIRTASLWISA